MEWKTAFHKNINTLWERAKDKNYRLSMEAYAAYLGTTRSSLRGWLAGKGQPDTEGLVRIATVESVSLAWLVGDKRKFGGWAQREIMLIEKFRILSEIHKEDICAFLDHFYKQDSKTPGEDGKCHTSSGCCKQEGWQCE